MNRIDRLFKSKKNGILSLYFTAGYPGLDDTVPLIKTIEQAGADLVEIGMPFSDPLADGPVIQASSQKALKNGMSINKLFEQLTNIRQEVNIPLILMGYLNPVMQYGMEKFCQKAAETGIDGVILPDLPLFEYINEFKPVFQQHGLHNIFLVTPQTSDERIRLIDLEASGFIYLVASSSTTGAKTGIQQSQVDYFKRIKGMRLANPTMIGFGISNKETFGQACEYANGAIIGSAFIKRINEPASAIQNAEDFISGIIST